MRKLLLIGLIVILAVGAWWWQGRPSTPTEDIYSQVMRTKTLRCGFVTYEPWVIKNPNTGELSGIMVEYFNAIGARLGLKVEWPAEVMVSSLATDLANRRIDALCVQCSPIPEYQKVMDFVAPFGHVPYYTYVRADAPATLDVPRAKFAAAEGFIPMVLTQQVYPSATLALFPQNTSIAELFDQLKYRKAEAIVHEGLSANGYMRNNPGVVKRWIDTPTATKDMSFPIKKNEPAWADFMTKNFALEGNPQNQQLMRDLMKKYHLTPDMFTLE